MKIVAAGKRFDGRWEKLSLVPEYKTREEWEDEIFRILADIKHLEFKLKWAQANLAKVLDMTKA